MQPLTFISYGATIASLVAHIVKPNLHWVPMTSDQSHGSGERGTWAEDRTDLQNRRRFDSAQLL